MDFLFGDFGADQSTGGGMGVGAGGGGAGTCIAEERDQREVSSRSGLQANSGKGSGKIPSEGKENGNRGESREEGKEESEGVFMGKLKRDEGAVAGAERRALRRWAKSESESPGSVST